MDALASFHESMNSPLDNVISVTVKRRKLLSSFVSRYFAVVPGLNR